MPATVDEHGHGRRLPEGRREMRNGLWSIVVVVVVGMLVASPALAVMPSPVCGNGVAESSEGCDGMDLRGATCEKFGYTGGTLSCFDTCQLDYSSCTLMESVCGNGTVEGEEECDVDTLNGMTCQNLEYSAGEFYAGGTLACGTGCTFDTSACFATRFEDNGDGTITDNQTGLMWEKKSDDGSIHDKDNTYTWNTAFGHTEPNGTAFTEFLGTLNDCKSSDGSTVSDGFAGYCDWRLPTIAELQGIVDTSYFPTVDPVFNMDCAAECTVTSCSCTAAGNYWSSASLADFPSGAWFVNFNFGGVLFVDKSSPLRVRAVRGGW
jgi:hypothetical protein